MSSTKFDSDSLQTQITSLQNENEKAKAEVKEVLQALEELAMNYDQKLQEVDNKNKENDKLLEDLTSKQVWTCVAFAFLKTSRMAKGTHNTDPYICTFSIICLSA